jgi:hypothetical protein
MPTLVLHCRSSIQFSTLNLLNLMYQPVRMTWAKHALVSKKSIASVFLSGLLYCGLLLGFCPGRLVSQGTYEVDLSEFVHSVWVTGGTLNANQVGTVNLNLGSSAFPVSDAMGLRLELVVSSDAYLPSNPLSVTVSGSWLLSGVELSQSLEVDGSTRTMYLTLERDPADGSANGYGFALSFPLVAAHNNVSASSMVASEGGVVIIENVDMRLAGTNNGFMNPLVPIDWVLGDTTIPARGFGGSVVHDDASLQVVELAAMAEPVLHTPALTKGLRLYPSPCVDRIQVLLPSSDEGAELRLVGMDGVEHSVEMTIEGGIGVADIVPMKRGVYFAEVVQAGNVVLRQRIQLINNE